MTTRTCAVDDCGRTHYCKGWCRRHYERWRKYGDPVGTPPPKPVITDCAIDDCSAPRYQAHWLCGSHYMRQYRYGDPHADMRRKDEVGYRAAHGRIRSDRGKADKHRCIDCGERAKDWSYRGGSPVELVGTAADGRTTCAYSPDPMDYEPPRV